MQYLRDQASAAQPPTQRDAVAATRQLLNVDQRIDAPLPTTMKRFVIFLNLK